MAKAGWKKYEEHILENLKEWAGPDAKIEFDKKLPGKFSGLTRRKINVTHADKFAGLVEDVQTDLGIL